MLYKIRIDYREPTYELYSGRSKPTYHWVYNIDAANADEAKEKAVDEFREVTANSQVGWHRDIVDIDVEQ